MSRQDKIYQMVTDQIIFKLKEGTVPWEKPWKGDTFEIPYNFKTKKPYRGINVLLLGCSFFSSKYWLSFKQIQTLGGKVKRGEKGTICVFWKILEKNSIDENGNEVKNKVPFLRYYKVFNLDQVEGIEEPNNNFVANHNTIEYAEELVNNMPNKPEIVHKQQTACYYPSSDTINLPKMETFNKVEEYYSTKFHELVHSTGHETRLNRKEIANKNCFSNQEYSFEELVAELGSAFLCAEVSIENDIIDNSTSYIKDWLNKLEDNPKWVVQAAAKAQKAVDYIINRKFD